MKLPHSFPAMEIAELIKAKISGNESVMLSGLNEIHRVEPGDISFVDHPKYYDKVLNSEASGIIINSEAECPEGKVLFISDDPFRDFNLLTAHFYKSEQMISAIHPTVKSGRDTIIHHGVVIGSNVVIGNHSVIFPGVVIYPNCIIGNRVTIHANAVIGSDAFYFKRRPEGYDKLKSSGRVIIGDEVEIGASCTIDRGVTADTIIGQGTKMDNHVHVGHDTVIGRNCLFAAKVGIAGVVTIEDDVILWGQVGVQKDLTIGKGAVVLGQSGIPKSLEGNKTYFGSPVRDAREKMKELAMIKSLPSIIDKLSNT
ncbi:MAG: UDP-3-O-(3-hydroxymyristoyl)glucosamine N-acyltransferase [Bacteroidia bacterium]|nr:UDP-3-O-(3-hydroxymyristoyl)glucosamine N-acyltransferase [Bacteroidia bacterium]